MQGESAMEVVETARHDAPWIGAVRKSESVAHLVQGGAEGSRGASPPGMATAGSGDVLAGIIAALLAQGLNPMHAASQGVLLHATAGDMAVLSCSEQGLTASTITEYIPTAITALVGAN